MRTAAEITEGVTWLEDMDSEQIRSIHECMKEYADEVMKESIKRISDRPTSTPEEGEDDYRPGKYMAIGMLYEFKEEIK